jgi:hypothetical protein
LQYKPLLLVKLLAKYPKQTYNIIQKLKNVK